MPGEGEGVLVPIEAQDSLSAALKGMSEQAERFMSVLEKMNGTLNRTGDEANQAEAKSNAFVDVLTKIKSVGDSINSYKIKDVFSGVENMSVAGLAVGASILDGTKKAMDMEHQLTKVGLSSRVTAEELYKLKEMSLQLAAASTISANQLAFVGGYLLKEGDDLKTAHDVMGSMSKLVSVFGGDYVSAFQQISSVTKAFGQDAKSIPETLDLIARVSSETNTDYTELLGALQSTAPFAKSAGMSMKELINVYGSFRDAGLDSEQSVRALRTSMMMSARAQVSYKDALAVVGKAYKSTNDETARAALLTQTFGRMGLTLGPVFSKLGGDYVAMTTRFKDSGGALDRAAETMDGAAKDRLEALHNRLETSQQIVADKYLPSVSATMGMLQKMPPEVLVVGTALTHMAGGLMLFAQTGLAILANWTALTGIFATATGWLVGMTGPIGIIASGAALLAADFAAWVAVPALIFAATYEATKWLMTLEKVDGKVHTILEALRWISGVNILDRMVDISNNDTSRGASASSLDVGALHKAGMGYPQISAMARTLTAPNVPSSTREHIREMVKEIGANGVHIENANFEIHGVRSVGDFERELQSELLRGRKNNPSAAPAAASTR